MTSLLEFKDYIGTTKMWEINDVFVPVKVLDVKTVFGRVDVLIVPVNGKGHVWVSNNALQNT